MDNRPPPSFQSALYHLFLFFGSCCKLYNTVVAKLQMKGFLITDPFKRSLRTPKPFDVEIEANNSDGYVDNYRVTAMNSGNQATFKRVPIGNTWIFKDGFDQELFHLKGQTSDDGLIIETRTSNPASPQTGRMWLIT